MADPAPYDVERHTFAGELDGVGVAQLMRREATSHTRVGGEPTEPAPDPGAVKRDEPLERDAVRTRRSPGGRTTGRPDPPARAPRVSDPAVQRPHGALALNTIATRRVTPARPVSCFAVHINGRPSLAHPGTIGRGCGLSGLTSSCHGNDELNRYRQWAPVGDQGAGDDGLRDLTRAGAPGRGAAPGAQPNSGRSRQPEGRVSSGERREVRKAPASRWSGPPWSRPRLAVITNDGRAATAPWRGVRAALRRFVASRVRTGRSRSDEAAVTWRTERISSVGG